MKCEYCELARECRDPARFGGGCDMDGVDDFGCGFAEEDEDEVLDHLDTDGFQEE